jgi:hypothetical protein
MFIFMALFVLFIVHGITTGYRLEA